MLIKSVSKTGHAIAFEPNEAAAVAVMYAIKTKNTSDTVFWALKNTIKIENCTFTKHPDGNWEAIASGTAMVGTTTVATDKFSIPRLSQFSVEYKHTKDSVGMPDIAVTEASFSQVGTNPSKMVGAVDTTNVLPQTVVGELAVESLKPEPQQKRKK